MISNKGREVQGLLYKVAELETLLILILGMLSAKEILSNEELESIFGVAGTPEILAARIKCIEEQGEALVDARKKVVSEMLSLPDKEPFTIGEDYGEPETSNDRNAEEGEVPVKDPNKKLH
jgi:hypothetical protein